MKKTVEQYLQNSFERWQSIYKNGCNDPFWSDGLNINLVRNHIIYYKNKIKEEYPDGNYPEIYYKETPAEMPIQFMAKPRKLLTEIVCADVIPNVAIGEQICLF
ncbi:hypothetical protein SDC9_82115 [bioreactor metagenome]|uniref:Uncharacterized protein n=1 Tax=bioreactor metagenome TaxID=1076179 RepID=A0A644Z3Z7_9ZZZZ